MINWKSEQRNTFGTEAGLVTTIFTSEDASAATASFFTPPLATAELEGAGLGTAAGDATFPS